MKVLLIGNYEHDRQESMQRFASSLCAGLRERGSEVTLIRPEPRASSWKPGAEGIGKWLGYVDKFAVFPVHLKQAIARLRGEARDGLVVHICDHSNAHYVRYLREIPHLVTCNDVLAIRAAAGEFAQQRTRWSGRQLQRLIAAGLRKAARITCISEATKADLIRVVRPAAKKITVTPMGLNYPYSPMAAADARARVARLTGGILSEASGCGYLLHVGGSQWYKNRKGVLRIYAALRERLGERRPKLFLIGPPLAAVEKEASRDDLWQSVIQISAVDNEDLRAAYSAAELLLFPSIAEGFGWPIVEAQACGCRVLTTGQPPMTEVGGAAAEYLEPPGDAPDAAWFEVAAAKVVTVLDQRPHAKETAVAAGLANARRFATSRMIEEYLGIYREVLSGGAGS